MASARKQRAPSHCHGASGASAHVSPHIAWRPTPVLVVPTPESRESRLKTDQRCAARRSLKARLETRMGERVMRTSTKAAAFVLFAAFASPAFAEPSDV